jgi:hypothetical protein
MSDQADGLRRLVRSRAGGEEAGPAPGPVPGEARGGARRGPRLLAGIAARWARLVGPGARRDVPAEAADCPA